MPVNYSGYDTTSGVKRPPLPAGFSYDANGQVVDAQNNPATIGPDGKPQPITLAQGDKVIGYRDGYPVFDQSGMDLGHKPSQSLSLTSIAEGDYTPATLVSDVYDWTTPQGLKDAIGGGSSGAGGSYDAQKYLAQGTGNAQSIYDLAMQRARAGEGPAVQQIGTTPITATNVSTPDSIAGEQARQMRGQQLAQIEAARNAPSAAAGQMRAGLGQAASAALAQAGAARGAERGAARRDAMLATQMGGMQAAGTTAALAAQEQAAREQSAQQGLAGVRAGDVAAGQVDLTAQQANQQAQLAAQTTTGQQSLAAQTANQTAGLQAYNLGTQATQGYLQGATQAQQAYSQATDVARSYASGKDLATSQQQGAIIGAVGAGLAKISDERAKEDIEPVDFAGSYSKQLSDAYGMKPAKDPYAGVGAGPIFDDFEERTRGLSSKDTASLLSSYENLAQSPSTPPTAHNRTWADFRGMNRDDDFETMMAKYEGLKRAEESARSGLAMADTQLSDERAKREMFRLGQMSMTDQGPPLDSAKDFIRRMYDQSPSSIRNPDGSHSTHEMASAEVSGKQIAYPSIVRKDGKLSRLGDDDALDFALRTGEYAQFETPEAAQEYAEGSWKRPLGDQYKTSDERAKQEVQQMGEGDGIEFARKVEPITYRYKPGIDDSDDGGARFGASAQQLESTGPIGKLMVHRDPYSGLRKVDTLAMGMMGLVAAREAADRAEEAIAIAKDKKKGGK